MTEINSENPWVLGGILIGVWIVISIGVEAVLLDGDVLDAIIRGGLAGGSFTIAFLYFRRRQ